MPESTVALDERLRNCNGDEAFVTGKAQRVFAETVCRSCKIQPECGIVGFERLEEYGAWGGFTERDRRAIARRGPESVRLVVSSLYRMIEERDRATPESA